MIRDVATARPARASGLGVPPDRLLDGMRRLSSDALVVQALTRVARGDLAGGLAAWEGAIEGGASSDLVARARPVLTRVEGRRPSTMGPQAAPNPGLLRRPREPQEGPPQPRPPAEPAS